MKFFLTVSFMACASIAAAQDRHACVIDPSFTVNLSSPFTGLLDEVLVDRGDWVEEGQTVARLWSRLESATVDLMKARAESDAEVAAQEARLRLAQQAHERVAQLFNQRISTREALEEREAALEVATRGLSEAQLRQRLAQLELQRAQISVEDRSIRAPIAGLVTERFLSPGEYLSSDDWVLTISRLDPLYVEAFVPTSLYGDVKIGQMATVYPNLAGSEPRDAKIVIVDRVFDATSDTFGVRLELANPDASLPAGQRCEVDFGVSK
ncbi:efflux RND transporter periplasmic adaptor subunit [Falsiruegeria mediterranea]|jgi:RND family efflux transporter MFP subunit|uniref:Cobalt-zinc-cadmium resistance protein CzcB n=1 Tax=Falsiruegeria mediterranea M17 TaxID=1200281 RepID=A0A2R8CEM5_9RHOB|nr:efflux RND transporter periplasmic adaptor subunit [Falsiruegeria mediterranea]SPJ30891.1 Cobalt-zinc-cadmium resistance protein CzcB [Falsiruegeria mediterranea M17]